MADAQEQKSSSEILNELFSTFNTSFSTASSTPKHSKKKTKSEEKTSKKHVKKKKKKKSSRSVSPESLSSSSSSAKKRKSSSKVVVKKKKKSKPDKSLSSDKIPIGDGFVVLKQTKHKRDKEEVQLEDGEIVEDKEEKRLSKEDKFESIAVKKSKKLSASQAYKLDAEEKVLLGYFDDKDQVSGYHKKHHKSHRSPTRSKSSEHKDAYHSSSSSRHRSRSPGRSRHRSRSRSPHSSSSSMTPRLAPPRDSYKSSYSKFQKQSSSDYQRNSDYHSQKYDTASYYDYHAKSSNASRSGFGYVGKSYYYDDVEESSRSSSRPSSSSWRHRDRSRSRSRSPRSRRSYYHPDDIIDKAELLEIARKNANKLLQRGVLPSDIFSRDQIVAIRAGGKSVDELTEYCKRLAKRDASGDAAGRSDDSDDDGGRFVHHPFVVKDKPLPTITMNIRNAIPLPVRTPQELAIESAKLRTVFPVSSGTQHRFKELEWKPVEEDDKDKAKKDPNEKALVGLDWSGAPLPTTDTEDKDKEGESDKPEESGVTAVTQKEAEKEKEDTGISVDFEIPNVDISSVIGLRLKAMRTLQERPDCDEAKKQLEDATKLMKTWADAKALEPKFLTPAELSSGPQAWAKRDQLRNTTKLDSGMGMHLLQKMGWKPGEGLGKNKEGALEPLALDVKTDKKGLTAAVEELMFGGKNRNGPSMPVVYDLSGKHPVSALMELCAKRRWGNPEFELCFEHGPPHKRQFVYKVIVNGVEYQPCVAVGNKKQAKANAAAFCLQSLGLLPTGGGSSGSVAAEMLQTVNANASEQTSDGSNSNPMQKAFSSQPTFLQTVSIPDGELMPPPAPSLIK